jgi:hypothetical protein
MYDRWKTSSHRPLHALPARAFPPSRNYLALELKEAILISSRLTPKLLFDGALQIPPQVPSFLVYAFAHTGLPVNFLKEEQKKLLLVGKKKDKKNNILPQDIFTNPVYKSQVEACRFIIFRF